MNVPEFLQEEFTEAWKIKSDRDFPGSLSEVRSAFNISAVETNVNRNINKALDRYTQERYQKVILRKLVEQYVEELYRLSSFGNNINGIVIQKAKENIKSRGCSVHPC